MWELLWLLIPAAAASGWWSARRSLRGTPQPPASDLRGDYFRGLNFLLDEQPDKAIEVFIRMAEVDGDTVETHLALGNLFRRRGEVDRAIRIHQNLIARPDLAPAHRAHALLELGQDYMRAGLLDRAELLFLELLEGRSHARQALENLIEIYEQEREWDKAISAARRLEAAGGSRAAGRMAQYCCELAEAALAGGETVRARQLIKRALSHDRRCVRASLLLGELHRRTGDHRSALRAFQRVAEQDIDFLPEAMKGLEECHRLGGSLAAYARFLRQQLPHYTGATLPLALARVVEELEGPDAAWDAVAEVLRRRPSVAGLGWMVRRVAGTGPGAAERHAVLVEVAERLGAASPGYVCSRCGFAGRTLHWQCPGCKSWNTVKPDKGLPGAGTGAGSVLPPTAGSPQAVEKQPATAEPGHVPGPGR